MTAPASDAQGWRDIAAEHLAITLDVLNGRVCMYCREALPGAQRPPGMILGCAACEPNEDWAEVVAAAATAYARLRPLPPPPQVTP